MSIPIKVLLFLLIATLVLVLLGLGIRSLFVSESSRTEKTVEESVASPISVTLPLSGTLEIHETTITPYAVLDAEDCPIVNLSQYEGVVHVHVHVQHGSREETHILALDEPLVVGDIRIRLRSVEADPDIRQTHLGLVIEHL